MDECKPYIDSVIVVQYTQHQELTHTRTQSTPIRMQREQTYSMLYIEILLQFVACRLLIDLITLAYT